MLTLLSILVAASCALASVRRLMWAVAPSSLDARLLTAVLERDGSRAWPALCEAVRDGDGVGWERDLFSALSEPNAAARAAFVNEQLTELHWRAQRWARVPRVCASIATSSGFFFGCITLLHTLSLSSAPPVAEGPQGLALLAALNALAVGIAGTSFCIAVHARARDVLRERMETIDRLVQRIECLANCSRSAA